jgi:hypothetical protein
VTQDSWILLLLRILLIGDVLSIAVFIGVYWVLADWWRHPIGRTIVIKDFLMLMLLVPSILTMFIHFTRTAIHFVAWVDVCLFALLIPVMAWRSAVWISIHRAGQGLRDDGKGGGADGAS